MNAVLFEARYKFIRKTGKVRKHLNECVAQIGTQLNQGGQIGV